MSISESSTTKHRTAKQWKDIVEQYHLSGLSGVQFCREQKIPYASFCKWRQKLSQPKLVEEHSCPGPQFIDIGSLPQSVEQSWHITLKLGDGIELSLTQQ